MESICELRRLLVEAYIRERRGYEREMELQKLIKELRSRVACLETSNGILDEWYAREKALNAAMMISAPMQRAA